MMTATLCPSVERVSRCPMARMCPALELVAPSRLRSAQVHFRDLDRAMADRPRRPHPGQIWSDSTSSSTPCSATP